MNYSHLISKNYFHFVTRSAGQPLFSNISSTIPSERDEQQNIFQNSFLYMRRRQAKTVTVLQNILRCSTPVHGAVSLFFFITNSVSKMFGMKGAIIFSQWWCFIDPFLRSMGMVFEGEPPHCSSCLLHSHRKFGTRWSRITFFFLVFDDCGEL